MVRDQALLASGLLTPTIGGPSVMPPQPAGLWNSIANSAKWTDATGPNRYRRALYTFIKRSAVYPSFMTFDPSAHLLRLPPRIPPNTPLQGLGPLNDPVYAEATAALAGRMAREVSAAATPQELTDARIRYGARAVLSRELSAHELTVLRALYNDARGMAAEVS